MALHQRGEIARISAAVLLASALSVAVAPGGQPVASSTVPLPCPLAAGWQTLLTLQLPRIDGSGRISGGFSAVAYDANLDLLELLSDAPRGSISRWSGLRALVTAADAGRAGARPTLQAQAVLPLRSGEARLAEEMDGEGLVQLGSEFWVAREGRRTAARQPQLLRFETATGRLRQALELPTAWQPGPGRGLEANKGPEALALWDQPARSQALLMASETALRQDPPGEVRLLEWRLDPAGATARPLRSLALPGPAVWALTDLLMVAPRGEAVGLLALLRRFEEPDRWGARLLLYPPPMPVATATARAGATPGRTETSPDQPLPPRHSWDLLANGPGRTGLPPDNWEGLTWGPTLADGRATLVLVTDDNFNPLQANWLAVLAPRRLAACSAKRSTRP